jgi:hypothetical protein
MNLTDEEITTAIEALRRSRPGYQSLDHLLRFLEGPGLSLDCLNKEHWGRLLLAAWGSKAGTVQWSLRDAIRRGRKWPEGPLP